MDSADTWHSLFSVTGSQAMGLGRFLVFGIFEGLNLQIQAVPGDMILLKNRWIFSGRRLASRSSCPAPGRCRPPAEGSYRRCHGHGYPLESTALIFGRFFTLILDPKIDLKTWRKLADRKWLVQ
jgi:hypothetical protein